MPPDAQHAQEVAAHHQQKMLLHLQEALASARKRGEAALGRPTLYTHDDGVIPLESQVAGHGHQCGAIDTTTTGAAATARATSGDGGDARSGKPPSRGLLRYHGYALKPLQDRARGAREVAFYETLYAATGGDSASSSSGGSGGGGSSTDQRDATELAATAAAATAAAPVEVAAEKEDAAATAAADAAAVDHMAFLRALAPPYYGVVHVVVGSRCECRVSHAGGSGCHGGDGASTHTAHHRQAQPQHHHGHHCDRQQREPKGHDYLVLCDVTAGAAAPCVMDVKIGLRTYGDDASEEKRRAEELKWPPQRAVGFRYTGMVLRRHHHHHHHESSPMASATAPAEAPPTATAAAAAAAPPPPRVGATAAVVLSKEWGRTLTAATAGHGLVHFFHDGHGTLRSAPLRAAHAALGSVAAWAQQQRVARFVGSSLLLAYEPGGGDSGGDGGAGVVLRLIDFAHAAVGAQVGGDDGFGIGVCSLYAHMCRLVGVAEAAEARGTPLSVEEACAAVCAPALPLPPPGMPQQQQGCGGDAAMAEAASTTEEEAAAAVPVADASIAILLS